jgi:hypothetical protein
MKNLLIYINPEKGFTGHEWAAETEILAKVQIDNSLALGWRKEDILLAMNFDYEYRGIKAMVVDDDCLCPFSPTASKIYVIIRLFELGIIGDDLYWFHDFDAFQLRKITKEGLGMNGSDMGITDYGKSSINEGRSLRWSTGSIFFKRGALDIFRLWKREIDRYRVNEEITLLETLKKGRHLEIKRRIKKLNITYNLATRKRRVLESYEIAEKPLKVIHFHPFDKRPLADNGEDNMAFCVHGKNKMDRPLVTEGLARIFRDHGIE